MVETSQDWSKKLLFVLWAYQTSFHTSIGITPYSLVYGMEAMLPVEIEMGSLRVALEQQIPKAVLQSFFFLIFKYCYDDVNVEKIYRSLILANLNESNQTKLN